MNLSRVWRGTVRGVLLAALAVLEASCSGSATDTFSAQSSQPLLTASPTPATTSTASQPKECMGTVGAGELSMSGHGIGSSSAYRTPGGSVVYSFSCGAADVSIDDDKIKDNAVTFNTADGSVTIVNGSSGTIGSYEITVLSVDGDIAKFKVVVPAK